MHIGIVDCEFYMAVGVGSMSMSGSAYEASGGAVSGGLWRWDGMFGSFGALRGLY